MWKTSNCHYDVPSCKTSSHRVFIMNYSRCLYSRGESKKQDSHQSNRCEAITVTAAKMLTSAQANKSTERMMNYMETYRGTLLEFNKCHVKMTYIYNYTSSDVQMVFTGTKMGNSHAQKKSSWLLSAVFVHTTCVLCKDVKCSHFLCFIWMILAKYPQCLG